MERYKTVAERKQLIESGNELSLAVEDRFTNLRIWSGKQEEQDVIYMRLDRANNYSAPLSEKSHAYLNKQDTPVKLLLKYGFITTKLNLDNILDITKGMKQRDYVEW